ncbi:MAG: hydrogenase [Patescibacteria group bacterium]|nr:hydrogenase [Patescibacteria group bacterium]
MNVWLDIALVLLILTNLHLLGSSRVGACIQSLAVQAVLLGMISLLAHPEGIGGRLVLLAGVSVVVKAGVLPWLLRRVVRDSAAQREVEPMVGFTTSLLLGLGLLGISLYIAGRLPMPGEEIAQFQVAAALFTVMVGLLLIITRKKALMQTLGYLAMENGIYAFGLAFAIEEPLLIEMGVLLDVFVGVFVMGIAIHHISREFDHSDTDRLSALRD